MDVTDAARPDTDVSRREVVVRLGAGGIAALLLAAGQRPASLAAQDATPAGPIGITAELLGVGEPTTTPGLELSLRRITFAPGGYYPRIATRARWSSTSSQAPGATRRSVARVS